MSSSIFPVPYHRVVLKQILKRVAEAAGTLRIPLTVQTIIPFDPGSQRALRDVRGTDINLTSLPVVKDIRLRMKRSSALVIKSQIYPVAELPPDQIQRGRLRDAKVIPRQNAHSGPAVQGNPYVIQNHLHTRLHQKRDDYIDLTGVLDASFQMIQKKMSRILPSGHHIQIFRIIKLSHCSFPLPGLTSDVIHCSSVLSSGVPAISVSKRSSVMSVKYRPFLSPSNVPYLKEV